MADEMSQSPAGPEQLLGELEAAIMQIVWQRQEATVRDVLEALQPTRPLKYTTVMTVMGRLAQKGVLATRKQGKSFYYHATATPQEFVAQRAQRAVKSVIADFGDLAMGYFIQELGAADPRRLARLRELAKGMPDQEQPDAR